VRTDFGSACEWNPRKVPLQTDGSVNDIPGIVLDTASGAILSVSSEQDVHARLERILQGAGWELLKNYTPADSFPSLQQRNIEIVICDDDLSPGAWRRMVRHISRMDDPPLLIVTARLADERLWAEALNLGAHNVLARPFDPTEIIRIVGISTAVGGNARKPAFGRANVTMVGASIRSSSAPTGRSCSPGTDVLAGGICSASRAGHPGNARFTL
jgi:CheY-like chemotaxis protein